MYKGFRSAIEASAMVRDKGVDVQLDLVGDGDARAELERWVSTLPIAPYVHFHGRISDAELEHRYRQARAFVLPSEGEGFGLVFVEAMAHGLPCVCVAAGAAPEVVSDDQCGLVARARDTADLADKMFVVASNARVHSRLRRGGEMLSKEHFAHEPFLQRLRSSLQLVISGIASLEAQ
jgi:phosphatidylinositol alpha-1,6-mannosyltransferase